MPWTAIVGAVVADALAPSTSGSQAQSMVDPFAPYRAQYGQQLNALMANPASVSTLPGYQAQEAAGANVLQRQMSASGQTQSGAEQIALQQYGQQYQAGAFNDQYNRLAQLSGASTSPTAGGQAGVAQNNTNSGNASKFGGAVSNGIVNGISNWMSPSQQSGQTSGTTPSWYNSGGSYPGLAGAPATM